MVSKAEKAFKRLHKKKGYKTDDLFNTIEYQDLIKATNSFFDQAIIDNVIPEAMLQSLRENIFVFSGLKTNAQLLEASHNLLTEDGNIKPFNTFMEELQKIKENYNVNYATAEYQFAVSSSQMASKWAEIEGNDQDYLVQYRTANDDRVREEHAELHDITLPASDKFWNEFYPPNAWRCRCTAVEVLKGEFKTSNSAKAIKAGKKATSQIDASGKNKLALFRFNPGQQKVVFPPDHPYTKLTGAKEVSKTIKDQD